MQNKRNSLINTSLSLNSNTVNKHRDSSQQSSNHSSLQKFLTLQQKQKHLVTENSQKASFSLKDKNNIISGMRNQRMQETKDSYD